MSLMMMMWCTRLIINIKLSKIPFQRRDMNINDHKVGLVRPKTAAAWAPNQNNFTLKESSQRLGPASMDEMEEGEEDGEETSSSWAWSSGE